MRLRHTLCFVVSAAVMTGCATVDLNDMATPSSARAEAPAKANVVERAANKLYAAFANRGFVAKTSRKRMRSATRILLEGLEDAAVTPTDGAPTYAARALPVATVNADMDFAVSHIDQTTRAAEIYLEMAPDGDALRKELSSLESALMASREAVRAFRDAGASDTRVTALSARVDALAAVTDRFGLHVRRKVGRDLAANRAADQS